MSAEHRAAEYALPPQVPRVPTHPGEPGIQTLTLEKRKIVGKKESWNYYYHYYLFIYLFILEMSTFVSYSLS